MNEKGDILIYQNSEGNIKIDVQLQEDSVWLSQEHMATLFGKAKSTINEHIKNIYKEQELTESDTLHKFGNSEFQQKELGRSVSSKQNFLGNDDQLKLDE